MCVHTCVHVYVYVSLYEHEHVRVHEVCVYMSIHMITNIRICTYVCKLKRCPSVFSSWFVFFGAALPLFTRLAGLREVAIKRLFDNASACIPPPARLKLQFAARTKPHKHVCAGKARPQRMESGPSGVVNVLEILYSFEPAGTEWPAPCYGELDRVAPQRACDLAKSPTRQTEWPPNWYPYRVYIPTSVMLYAGLMIES
jgi:hypothetical protein